MYNLVLILLFAFSIEAKSDDMSKVSPHLKVVQVDQLEINTKIFTEEEIISIRRMIGYGLRINLVFVKGDFKGTVESAWPFDDFKTGRYGLLRKLRISKTDFCVLSAIVFPKSDLSFGLSGLIKLQRIDVHHYPTNRTWIIQNEDPNEELFYVSRGTYGTDTLQPTSPATGEMTGLYCEEYFPAKLFPTKPWESSIDISLKPVLVNLKASVRN